LESETDALDVVVNLRYGDARPCRRRSTSIAGVKSIHSQYWCDALSHTEKIDVSVCVAVAALSTD